VTTLSVIELILAVTIIALAGIAIVAAASLLVQSASATDVMTTTSSVEGEQEEAISSTTTTTTNNVSNALLGSLFLTGEDKLTSFNPINETYTEVSYVGNRTIIPPDATTTTAAATINATETGNLTLNLQPNGITFVEGQSLLVTEGGGSNNGAEQENATAVFVDLNGVRPDDPRSSTGVVFFSTNSTGQLAFLDNMLAIYQVKASPVGTAIGMWEWKGGEVPFENMLPQS
jgi:type II secretory pathway pseudopilin PulG